MNAFFKDKPAFIVPEHELAGVDSHVCIARLMANNKLVLMARNGVEWEPLIVRGIETGFWDTRSNPNTDYDEVFRNYRKMGANCCLFMLHWGDFEPEDGCFDFTFPDGIVAAAKAHGVKVWFVLFTHHEPKASEPDFWAYHLESDSEGDHAVQWARHEDGNTVNTIAGLRALKPRVEIYPCYSNPAVFSRILRAIRALARHYRHSDTVIGLQVGNEEGYTYREEGQGWDSDFNPHTLAMYEDWKRSTGKASWHAFKMWSVKWWWRQFTTAFHEEDPYKPTSFNLAGGQPEAGYPLWIHFEGTDASIYGDGNIDVVGTMFYGRDKEAIWENLDQRYDYIYRLPILIPSEIGLGPRWGQTAVAQKYVLDTLRRGAQGFSLYMYGELVGAGGELTAYGGKFRQWTDMLACCEGILWSGVPGWGSVAVSAAGGVASCGCLHAPDGSTLGIINFPGFFNKDDNQPVESADLDIDMVGVEDATYSLELLTDGVMHEHCTVSLLCRETRRISIAGVAESSVVFLKLQKIETKEN